MNRIVEKFAQLKKENKKALIPYICAGDPTLEKTIELVKLLEDAGADVIELGIPYSDPLADGAVIEAAALRALGSGFKIDKFFDTVAEIRKVSDIPLAAMVYFSSIIGYGVEKFVSGCEKSGIDGLIVPDLPYEEYDDLKPYIDKTDMCLVPLIAITSGDRIPKLVEGSKGFIYCVSSLGVTGERASFDERVDNFLADVKAATDTPVCIGFGISRREDVERFDRIADGAIIGSAIVRHIHENIGTPDAITAYIKELKG